MINDIKIEDLPKDSNKDWKPKVEKLIEEWTNRIEGSIEKWTIRIGKLEEELIKQKIKLESVKYFMKQAAKIKNQGKIRESILNN